MQEMAHNHNSIIADNEPSWGSVDKTALPRSAFAEKGDSSKKSTWGYPHHWIKGGTRKDKDGIWIDGTMYLHEGGWNAAWAAAQGSHTGKKAVPHVISHLLTHRPAILRKRQKKQEAISPVIADAVQRSEKFNRCLRG